MRCIILYLVLMFLRLCEVYFTVPGSDVLEAEVYITVLGSDVLRLCEVFITVPGSDVFEAL